MKKIAPKNFYNHVDIYPSNFNDFQRKFENKNNDGVLVINKTN